MAHQPRPGVLIAAALAAVLAAAAAAGAQPGTVIDRVMALVNGRLVTLSDVRAARQLGLIDAPDDEAALDRYVDRVLVLEEVDRYAPPAPDPGAVEAALAAVVSRFPDRAAFDAALAAAGFDERRVRLWVRDDIRIHAYLEQRFAGAAEPGDDEVEARIRDLAARARREGGNPDPAALRPAARDAARAARREALVAEWLAGLRQRAEIMRPAAR